MDREAIKNRLVYMIQKMFSDIGADKDILEYVDFIDDFGMDSITFISIVVEIEDIFGITIPDKELDMENFRSIEKNGSNC